MDDIGFDKVIFKGPKCKLKGLHYQSKDIYAPVALVLHHELKGRDMPLIVKSVMKVLIENGFSIFFFDFTRLDNIITNPILKREEELNELICALDFINKKHFNKTNLWLLSFYASTWVGLQIIMRRPEITDYILFSPPPKLKDFSFLVPCSATGLIIYETQIPNSTNEIVEKLLSKSETQVDTVPFNFTDMSNPEHVDRVIKEFRVYLLKRLEAIKNKEIKIRRDRRRRRRKITTMSDEERIIRVHPIKELDLG
jgi:alpha/beta superfamily hydrolase